MKRLFSPFMIIIVIFMACESFEELEFFEVQTLDTIPEGPNSVKIFGEINNLENRILLEYGFLVSSKEDCLQLKGEQTKISVTSIEETHVLGEEASTNFVFNELKGDEFNFSVKLIELAPGNYFVRTYAIHIREETGKRRTIFGATKLISVQVRVDIDLIEKNNNQLTLTGEIDQFLNLGNIGSAGHALFFSEEIVGERQLFPTQNSPAICDTDQTKGCFTTTVSIPEFNRTYYARAFVEVNNEIVVYSENFLPINCEEGWSQLDATMPDGIWGTFVEAADDAAYLGIGCRSNFCSEMNSVSTFWKFTPDNNQSGVFEEICNFKNIFRINAVSFLLENKIYYGLGRSLLSNGTEIMHDDFWVYELGDTCFQYLGTFDGTARWGAVAFVIDDKAYVGTGIDSNGIYLDDFYSFNPMDTTWKALPNVPISFEGEKVEFGRSEAIGFSINGKGYIGLGRTEFGTFLNDFWEFDPMNPHWSPVGVLDIAEGISGAAGFQIGDKYYFGTGYTLKSQIEWLTEFWEFDPSSEEKFILRTDFQGEGREFAIGFAINNRGFLGTGMQNSGQFTYNDIWEYFPRTE